MAFDKNHTSLWMKIVIIFFAVILVVSLCLPFFSGCVNQAAQNPADEPTGSSTSTADTSTVAGVESQYATLIASLTDRLSLDPTSMTYLGNLGNAYMDCAMAMRSAGDASSNEAKVAETFQAAVDYYDQYLAEVEEDPKAADQDSINTITVDRAVCVFYAGDEDQAVEDLTAFLNEQPDYAMGWYNLGAFYEQMDEGDKAREAYNKVVELDPDGTAGSYAQLRLMILDAMAQQEADDSSDEGSAADGTANAGDAAGAGDEAETVDNDADAANGDVSSSDADGTEADAS